MLFFFCTPSNTCLLFSSLLRDRGNLNLTVLPTSDLRLSFVGDDGSTERLFTLSGKSQCSDVTVHEIAADNSGRSFLMKVLDGKTYYFWCSEKSKLLGIELLTKVHYSSTMDSTVERDETFVLNSREPEKKKKEKQVFN